jgi:large conductance mechanosensitive channel
VSGFRKFLMRGNLIDLAVAVVVGVAFNTVVQSLISGLITPLITLITGQRKVFADLAFRYHSATFVYGSFINALVSFVVISAVVYFLLVAPAAKLTAIAQRNQMATDRQCPECLSLIPIGAKRCMYCTSEVPPVEVLPAPAPTPLLRRRRRQLASEPPAGGPSAG